MMTSKGEVKVAAQKHVSGEAHVVIDAKIIARLRAGITDPEQVKRLMKAAREKI